MKRNLVFAFWGLFLALSTAACGQPELQVAPKFELPELTSGQSVKLANYKGKVVYVDFWASWCKPCVKSFPKLNALQVKYEKQGFEVIAINLDQHKAKAQEFLQRHPVDYTVLYDEHTSVAQAYKVQAMPSSYFIDKTGKIRLSHKGFVPGDEKKIEKAIQVLLAE